MGGASYSTNVIGLSGRMAFWRDLVCSTFVELDCQRAPSGDFFANLRSRDFLDLQWARIDAAGQRVTRSRGQIARSRHDCFLVNLQLSGRSSLHQNGRMAELTPGDFVLYDTTQPYEMLFDAPFSQLVLRIPRAQLAHRLVDAERLTAYAVSGHHGTGQLASSFLNQFFEQIDALAPASATRLQTSTIDLLTAALAEQSGRQERGQSENTTLLMQRILRYIEAHLADPGLTCQSVAAAHGISERYLRKLFEDHPFNPSAWIWHCRLERARSDLLDPLCAYRSVTSIGYDWGFKDSAHFSRAFKAKYGMAPRALRPVGDA